VVVLLILAVVHQLFQIAGSDGTVGYASQYVTAFVVGFFPLVGLQALQRIAGKVLHVVVQQTAPEYPSNSWMASTSGTRHGSPKRAWRTCRTSRR